MTKHEIVVSEIVRLVSWIGWSNVQSDYRYVINVDKYWALGRDGQFSLL
jgi:hypothetical protein